MLSLDRNIDKAYIWQIDQTVYVKLFNEKKKFFFKFSSIVNVTKISMMYLYSVLLETAEWLILHHFTVNSASKSQRSNKSDQILFWLSLLSGNIVSPHTQVGLRFSCVVKPKLCTLTAVKLYSKQIKN
ncbi:hypothetical protein BpHYR1_032483 [Brachionus plicatilis]|uniref:Uncharacterized protein n=1 Tax=Brachionus plicatilis TaxID=10195 RepID=A0A3M7QKX1_BRAPC|nr:hypothetical protein BpHYR1_032483 [Brachionus plicatilis]